MEKIKLLTPEPISESEKEQFDRIPDFMRDFIRKRLTGISNLTQTPVIQQLTVNLEHRLKYLNR